MREHKQLFESLVRKLLETAWIDAGDIEYHMEKR